MVQIIYLKGSIQLIKERISRRNDHFMPPGLLQSQFNVLEEPDENANCITISIANDPSSIVDLIYTKYFVCIK